MVELVKQVWEIPTNIKRDLLVVMTLSAKMITEATVKIIYSDSENHTYFKNWTCAHVHTIY